jgi:hypothetical protein
MISVEEGSAEIHQLSQAEVLQLAQEGKFSPEEAERWAKNHSYPPFAPGPVHSPAGTETDHPWLTLAMAAAWFTWLSPLAVHHQSRLARIGWKRWVVVEPSSNAFLPPKSRLEDFGAPTAWDVFSEAIRDPRPPYLQRGVPVPPAPTFSDLKSDLPYGRLKKALQSGRLVALTGGNRDRVPRSYWRANFDAEVRGILNSSRAARQGKILFRRDEVIEAERFIAKAEFDLPVVGREQAIGWIACRNVENFRSLAKNDLRGKQYHGAKYELDYSTVRPEKELLEALVAGRIKGYKRVEAKMGVGYREWKELTLTDRMDLQSVWDIPTIQFFRDNLIEVWPSLSETSGAPGPRSSLSSVSPGRSADGKKGDLWKRAHQKTGPKTSKTVSTIRSMRADIASEKYSLKSLREENQESVAFRYGVGRTTAVKALLFLEDEARILSAANSDE